MSNHRKLLKHGVRAPSWLVIRCVCLIVYNMQTQIACPCRNHVHDLQFSDGHSCQEAHRQMPPERTVQQDDPVACFLAGTLPRSRGSVADGCIRSEPGNERGWGLARRQGMRRRCMADDNQSANIRQCTCHWAQSNKVKPSICIALSMMDSRRQCTGVIISRAGLVY